jgi:hypothetical protein
MVQMGNFSSQYVSDRCRDLHLDLRRIKIRQRLSNGRFQTRGQAKKDLAIIVHITDEGECIFYLTRRTIYPFQFQFSDVDSAQSDLGEII